MKIGLATAACVLVLATGCARVSDSRLNPFNWFGRSEQVQPILPPDDTAPPGETRGLIDQVTQLTVERTPGGAIIRATGLPPRQGYWEGELVPADPDGAADGVLVYQFRAAEPPTPTRVSTQVSRLVEVGTFLTNQTLAGVREIRVEAARNARAARR